MGISNHLVGSGEAYAAAVAAFTTSFPDFAVPASPTSAGSYISIPLATDRVKTPRGLDIEFFGNAASTAYDANEVWLGFSLPGERHVRVRQYGTIGLTTGATALTNLATELGLNGQHSWYPCSTISTAWSLKSYANNIVEPISLIASSAVAPSENDMANAVLTLPYLDGATHLIIRAPNATATNRLAVAVRAISMDQ